MGQNIVNFRLEEDLKKQMEDTCEQLGITMTTALTLFIKKVVREKKIPFEISTDEQSEIEKLHKRIDDLESLIKEKK